MNGQACENCRFFLSNPACRSADPAHIKFHNTHEANRGKCRRHAPGTNNSYGQPTVGNDDWCGDYEPMRQGRCDSGSVAEVEETGVRFDS